MSGCRQGIDLIFQAIITNPKREQEVFNISIHVRQMTLYETKLLKN